jgi:hypothetical protein
MAHSKRGWLQYQSDPVPFNALFDIKADATTAANNGQSLSPVIQITNFWPLHTSDLRHGYGVDAGGVRDSCVATGFGSAVFTLGGTWSDNVGNSYTTIGLRNERFRTRDLR